MAYTGITSGMTYREFLAFVFDLNSQTKKKLSDPQIIIKVIKEFPQRPELLTSLTQTKIKFYRRLYNEGTLSRHYPAPVIPSFKYIKGVAVGKYDSPLTPNAIKLRLIYQARRCKKDHAERLAKELKKPEPRKPKKKPKVRKSSIRKRIRISVKKAHKQFSQRLWLQKQDAKLRGLPPWEE